MRIGPLGLLLACLVLVGCESAASHPAVQSRAEWAEATNHLLTSGLHLNRASSVLVLPAVSSDDIYATALAIVGAGDSIDQVVDASGLVAVTQRFRSGLTPQKMNATVGGPMTTIQAVLEADSRIHVLNEVDRTSLRVALDTSLASPGDLDLYTAAAAVDVATRLGHRIPDARRAFQEVSKRDPLTSCGGSELLYQIGVAVAIGAEILSCPHQNVDHLWSEEVTKLQSQVDDLRFEPGLGASQALLALSRIAVARQYPSNSIVELGSILDRLNLAFAAGRVGDVTAMSADSDAVSRLLMRQSKPSEAQLAHLRLVVIGGGDASTTALDARSLALVLRTSRAVGHGLTLPSDWPRETDATARLELVLANDGSIGEADVTSAVAYAIRANEPHGAMAIVRGLASLKNSACSVVGAIDFSRSVVKSAASTSQPAVSALAIHFLRQCGPLIGEIGNAQATILAAQTQVLKQIDRGDAEQPTLLEAWQAVAALCALDPRALPSTDELWSRYGSQSMSFGGAKSTSTPYVDISATFALATITGWTQSGCLEVGTLG